MGSTLIINSSDQTETLSSNPFMVLGFENGPNLFMPFSYIEREQVHFVKQDRISGNVTIHIFILFTISKENANMCLIDLHVWGLLS